LRHLVELPAFRVVLDRKKPLAITFRLELDQGSEQKGIQFPVAATGIENRFHAAGK